jgi:HAMP domain-containing protein
MIIICEECGKKYNIDPNRMKNDNAWVTCKSCRHRFEVVKPRTDASESSSDSVETLLAAVPVETSRESDAEATAGSGPSQTMPPRSAPAASGRQARKFGLTLKFLIFMLVPFVCIYAASSVYSLYKMRRMNDLAMSETTDIVWRVAKRSLRDKAESVALQARQYLYSHPDLKNDAFNRDIYFKKIANQKMGVTGYTFLYELPGPDGIWRIWAHVDPKLVGIDLKTLNVDQGKDFSDFWKVFTAVRDGAPSEGFYTWPSAKGKPIDKYMVAVPVTGTPYVVAATTDTKEFVRPIEIIEAKVTRLSGETGRTNMIALLAGFLLLGTIIVIYGRSLTARIRRLASVADRICVGELDARIEISANDEIGELENAIGRMRDSIKVSIERLRRRRRAA